MDTAVQFNQYDIDLASYGEVTQGIINKILVRTNKSNEIKSLWTQLDVTRWSAVQAKTRLDRTLARTGDREVARLKMGSGFRDAPVFNGKHSKEL